MKLITAELLSHNQQEITTLCSCWKITRTDGAVLTFTDHDDDLVISGLTYKSSDSYTRTALKQDQTLAVDNLEVIGLLENSAIRDQDMRNGKYDYAEIQMFVVNWNDLSQGILRMRQGWIGEVVLTPTGVFKAELRGLTQSLTMQFGDLYSPICRADLGDTKCQFDLASVTKVGTVTGVVDRKTFVSTPLEFTPFSRTNVASIIVANTMTSANVPLSVIITVAGVATTFTGFGGLNYVALINLLVSQINTANIGVTATAFFSDSNTNAVKLTLNDVTLQARVEEIGDDSNYLTVSSFADGYMIGGIVTWLTGNNTGTSMEIKVHTQSSSTVGLFLNMKFPIQVGDTFDYTPGCDKRRETCTLKFNNMVNFRGEPDMPGMDAMLTYPEFSIPS